MTLQNELYMFFRRSPQRNLLVDTLLCRWKLTGLIRKAMSTLSMGMFIASQSRNYELGAIYINMLNQAINAHVYIVSLPAIVAINADDIYRQPVLHQYYLQFPKYRDHHEEIRELILKEKYIRDNVEGITALVEYFDIEELYDKITWFAENPTQLPIAVSTFLIQSVLQFVDDAFRVINYISSVFRADDLDLLRHIVSVKLLRAVNVMHDADFTMQASMIYQLNTYRHVFAEMQRKERPRPFLHYGTSQFTMTPEGQTEETIIEYPQPLEREHIVKVPMPPITTTYAFEHEGVRQEHFYRVYHFGEVIRSAPSPSTNPTGIGGDEKVIWHCDFNARRIYELSTTDFSVIRSAQSPTRRPSGIGGDATVIWHCETDRRWIFELSTTDFSVIRTGGAVRASPVGIGGDAKKIWQCSCDPRRWGLILERSATDFSTIRIGRAPDRRPGGIGGDATVIWYSDYQADGIFKLSTTDFSVIRFVTSPGPLSYGIGGNKKVIWHSDIVADMIYELAT